MLPSQLGCCGRIAAVVAAAAAAAWPHASRMMHAVRTAGLEAETCAAADRDLKDMLGPLAYVFSGAGSKLGFAAGHVRGLHSTALRRALTLAGDTHTHTHACTRMHTHTHTRTRTRTLHRRHQAHDREELQCQG
jgi:hypothetical protein